LTSDNIISSGFEGENQTVVGPQAIHLSGRIRHTVKTDETENDDLMLTRSYPTELPGTTRRDRPILIFGLKFIIIVSQIHRQRDLLEIKVIF